MTYPFGSPPPPPSPYGYPLQAPPPLNPFADPTAYAPPPPFAQAPERPAGLPWSGVVIAVVITALISVGGTFLAMQGSQKSFVLSNGDEPTFVNNGPAAPDPQDQIDLENDVRSASIAEQSYATDNNGSYLATVASSDTSSPLLQQGLRLSPGAQVTVNVSTTVTPRDSYCITAVSTRTPAVWYLSSTDGVATRVKPIGCT